VTADAQAGALWRAELRIREPSMPLQHSISGIFHAVYPGTVASSDPRALVATTGTEISHPGPRRPRAGTGVQPGRPRSHHQRRQWRAGPDSWRQQGDPV